MHRLHQALPTKAISGGRDELHFIDPTLCIDCGACGVVCPPEAILDTTGEVCRFLKKHQWPKAVVAEDECTGSGCELCISICPFNALSLEHPERIADFFGVSMVDERKCTGCRLCEDICGWGAIQILPLRGELLKTPNELTEEKRSLVRKAKACQMDW
ncbi:MAG TPA: 4Fe-4S binding protein [Tepidiformaceae bacterium]